MRWIVIRLSVLSLLWFDAASAQTPEQVRRVIVLAEGRAVQLTERVVVPELAKVGFERGRNLTLDIRAATPSNADALAHELVTTPPDLIIAVGNLGLVAVKRTGARVPVVGLGPDFVELGYAETLSRPGGNLTGVVILSIELNAKRLALLHEAAPGARRIAVLMHPLSTLKDAHRDAIKAVGTNAGIEVLFFEAAEADDPVFVSMRASGAQALAINADPQFAREGAKLAALAGKYRLATICQWREMADQGCLLSYGPSLSHLYARVADIAARILKGADPSSVPIEQPDRFELVVNLKTAQALGLTIPPTLLARADEVIE